MYFANNSKTHIHFHEDIQGVFFAGISGLIRYIFIGKGKAIPLQAWRFPEGSRRLRLPDFKTIGT